MIFENPFSIDRAEHLGDDLYKFFSNRKDFQGLLGRKSLVMEGGRGCGKTMFFLYHSYENRKKEYLEHTRNGDGFIESQNNIGIYFRADSDFVTGFSLKDQNEHEWLQLFSHFLNLTIAKRLCEIIIDIKSLNQYEFRFEKETCYKVTFLLGVDTCNLYNDLLEVIALEELKLIRYINNISRFERPIVTLNGHVINIIVKGLQKEAILKNKTFHVFIDEYENLLEYQQQLINTLIKHPDPTVFNIGLRKEGIKTFKTLAVDEVINYPHDYDYFEFEAFESDKEYEAFVIDSCKKRLKSIDILKDLPDNSEFLDIRFYLGEYDLREEVKSIIGDNISDAIYKKEILKELQSIKDLKERKRIYKILAENKDPLINRLNLCLLLRKRETPYDLLEELDKYEKGHSSKYKNWIDNNAFGIVFLLCRDYKRKKKYYGFKTYLLLSSGIIRYFHEFCENAFKNAARNNFSFSQPRPLNDEEQTKAANYVSQYKINDIDTYTPYGSTLKRFTLLLGKIFENLHKDRRLSEPEKNHFATDFDTLDDTSKKVIKSALLWSVLQKRKETKDKASNIITSNQFEFHLNHVYAPYFQISYRKKRKLDINSNDLSSLISGTPDKANGIANKIIKNIIGEDPDTTERFKQLTINDMWIYEGQKIL